MNVPLSQLTEGAMVSFRKTMTVAEQAMFTGISGNLGGLYVDAVRARKAGAANVVAFELAVSSLATTCLARLGGPDRRIGSIALTFTAPVIVGDSVEAKAEIVSIAGDDVTCRIVCTLQPADTTVVEGTATLVPFVARG